MKLCNTDNGYVMKAYLGLTYIDSSGQTVIITEQMFNEFVPTIASAFPNGFTIFNSVGGYQFEGTTFIEPSKVLEIITPKDNFIVEYKKFVNLVRQYSQQFFQQSELYTVQETFYKAQSSSDPVDQCRCKCKCKCSCKCNYYVNNTNANTTGATNATIATNATNTSNTTIATNATNTNATNTTNTNSTNNTRNNRFILWNK